MRHSLRDKFAKKFGASKRLGKDFLQAVVALKMPSNTLLFPYLRNALIALQLVSPKVEDGFARFLSVGDVNKLGSKTMLESCTEAEHMIAAAWEDVNKAVDAKTLASDQGNSLFGRLAIRCVMYVTKTGKRGVEGKEFPNLAAILTAFDRDMSGKVAAAASDACVAPKANEPKPDEGTPNAGAASLDQVSSAKWIAERAGFKPDSIFTTKSHPGVLFTLTTIDESQAIFVERSLGPWRPKTVATPVADLKKEWNMHKGINLPILIQGNLVPFETTRSIAIDVARAKIWLALVAISENNRWSRHDISFLLNPAEVRVKTPIAKHGLVLVPTTDSMLKISQKKKRACIRCAL